MEEMIAAEPSLVVPILGAKAEARAIAEVITFAAASGQPIAVVGCGTSETAAMAVTDLIAQSLRRAGIKEPLVHARQALEASLDPWSAGVCLGISHEGGTRATILAMEAARSAGAKTALITARPQSPGAKIADAIFATPLIDRSWCHTVGYLSPILAGAAIAEAIAPSGLDPLALQPTLQESLQSRLAAESLAQALFGIDRLIVTGAGPDRSPACELALKLEEGVHLPSRMLDLETVFHGHLAASDRNTGLVIIATGGDDRASARIRTLIEAVRPIGLRVGAIVSPALDRILESQPAMNRVILPTSFGRHGLIGRIACAALAQQQLTVALTRIVGTNPDLIRRDEEPYREAALVADQSTNW